MAKKKAAKNKAAKKKPAKKSARGPSLNAMYNEVSRRADTAGLKISAAETRRVLATFFDLLEDCDPRDAFAIVGAGLAEAGKRRR